MNRCIQIVIYPWQQQNRKWREWKTLTFAVAKKWKMFKMNFTIKYEKYEQNEREMKKDEYWKGQLGKTQETLDYS